MAPFENALKILGQIALISIIFKVFEESILNPLYKCFSKQNIDESQRQHFVKKFLIYYFSILGVIGAVARALSNIVRLQNN